MKRKIIKIHEEKCNGCGLCVTACHEKAIELVNGKAKLVSDIYCDGLGDCLPNCPTAAIEIIEREADEYDDDAVKARILELDNKSKEIKHINVGGEEKLPCGCPGTMAKTIERKPIITMETMPKKRENTNENNSELMQWPVQLNLINTSAPYLKDANLLVAADCTAYAYGNFHRDFMNGKVTVIGCPKLDDNEHYKNKLTEILKKNNIKSITVVRMEVPCCSGIVASVKSAMLQAQIIVPYKEVIIGTNGDIIEG
ncbi:(Fe-S)-binding protein [Clostridium sulfidigenes]|uniref:(Fe-S)-binding protein n=1 Tax=Clostridium sulfidigenes TaxID=318464 RepID=A0A084JB19_9CLOT|nr:4Fe-4S dicluster domain-containing protein [Clostridium sulfidigenes]KEZ86153.1 (Fe-S)-binding protein [Clostridium sulfidigenes]